MTTENEQLICIKMFFKHPADDGDETKSRRLLIHSPVSSPSVKLQVTQTLLFQVSPEPMSQRTAHAESLYENVNSLMLAGCYS